MEILDCPDCGASVPVRIPLTLCVCGHEWHFKPLGFAGADEVMTEEGAARFVGQLRAKLLEQHEAGDTPAENGARDEPDTANRSS